MIIILDDIITMNIFKYNKMVRILDPRPILEISINQLKCNTHFKSNLPIFLYLFPLFFFIINLTPSCVSLLITY